VVPAADAILTIADIETKAVANGGLMLVPAKVIKSQLVWALTVDGVAEVKAAVTVDLIGKLAETVKLPLVLVVVMMTTACCTSRGGRRLPSVWWSRW